MDEIFREKYKQIIRNFEQDSEIDALTAETARHFMNLLPENVHPPRMGPDGEGSLILVWKRNSSLLTENLLLITIDGETLHMVKNATKSTAEYFEDIPFIENEIPAVIEEAFDNFSLPS